AKEMGDLLKGALVRYLDEVMAVPVDKLLEKRYEKHRRLGFFVESEQQRLVSSGAPIPGP
ncbi:MAG TPA: hypothetical protein VEN81_06190, partial [Planctomycetota bacterium]|nr:hypothetical protein [Planctomycetota bacterium]